MQFGSRVRMFVRSVLLLPLVLAAGVIPSSARAAEEAPAYVPGEILVGMAKPGANGLSVATPAQAVEGVGRVIVHNPKTGVARVELNRGVSLGQAIAALRGRAGVRYAEPNYLRHITATPDDTSYASKQWGPLKVRMDLAWDTWQPQAQQVVAVIDTGVDLNHPDLADVLYKDGLGNVIGYNAVSPANSPNDDHGHGTHCAGIAAAHINNGTGIAGIAGWNPNVGGSGAYVRVMPVKSIGSNGSGSDLDVAEGVYWAVDHGASVLSMSVGGSNSSTTLSDAIAYATSHGVVVCAAAGNNGSSNKFYPAAYPEVISVAATDSTDTLAGFSNYGTWVKVAAPGVNIYSTLPTYAAGGGFGTNYGNLSGTSMATPHVAGEAVMLRSSFPSLTNLQINAIIINNVDPYKPYSTHTIAGGAGRINVQKALLSGAAGSGGLISVSLSPNPVTGGANTTGTVTLGTAAPAGGKVVTLSSDTGSVGVPASVTIPEGATSATFTATTQPTASPINVTLQATVPENTLNALLLVNPPMVSGLSLSPASVAGGNSSTGTVTINGPAPAGGRVVTLTSSKTAATVPASVTVAEGDTTATFTVSTTPVTASTGVTITAKTGTISKAATLTVKPPTPLSVVFNPKTVMAGNSSTGTVTLTGPAPTGGTTVTLSSNKPEVTVPANVLVAEGATTANFTAGTSNVTVNLSVTVSAVANGVTKGGSLTVIPVLKSVTVSPSSAVGGKTATGTVTLNGAAPAGGITVSLSTTNSAVTVPASVTVVEGATTGTFVVTTSPVASNTTGTISGSYGGVTKPSATFTVKPPALSGFSFTPSSVVVGATSTGKLTISGPAPAGFTVNLTSANPSVAPVPASVTFAAGATTATFPVTGGPVGTSTAVSVTAKDPALVTKTATLTVKP